MKILIAVILIASTLTVKGQMKQRQLSELIDNNDPAWPLVQKWIKEASNNIKLIAVDSSNAKEAILKVQVTTHSILGSFIYDTGGLLIDDGWLRVLGSPNLLNNRSIVAWNNDVSIMNGPSTTGYLLIADDAAGVFFALNGGGLGSEVGKFFYLSADGLEWENLELSYGDLLQFCLKGNLDEFYKGLRWKGWRKDVVNLKDDAVFSFYPFLWTKEGKDVNKVLRESVPVKEAFLLKLDMMRSLSTGR